ncbi:MAG: hypothetical protein UR82_C0034G0004 [Candidatus Moranbacteria bacterium GW2011_GWF1_35_5]|nr:MAG: hypothetical protein UR82_C0034G0004 [Candidatus Moranbacteria bacterium GW2011_GWF1_35_5]
MKNNKTINPYCSIAIFFCSLILVKANNNLEPSSGGIGIRLKTARKTLIVKIITNNQKNIAANDPERRMPSSLKLNILLAMSNLLE